MLRNNGISRIKWNTILRKVPTVSNKVVSTKLPAWMIQFAELLLVIFMQIVLYCMSHTFIFLYSVEVFRFIPHLLQRTLKTASELFCVPKTNHSVSRGKHDFNWYGNKYVVGMLTKIAFIDLNNRKSKTKINVAVVMMNSSINVEYYYYKMRMTLCCKMKILIKVLFHTAILKSAHLIQILLYQKRKA